MSGGVDSTVCIARLQKMGFTVVGVHFVFFGEADPRVLPLAQKFGIECEIIDIRQKFTETVVADFLENYRNGRTPSPCCLCNPALKFPLLAEYAGKYQADYLATGHYVRTEKGQLLRAKNLTKDQSYFLYRVPSETLERCLFPLGEVADKKEIISEAEILGLNEIITQNVESQDFCFLQGQTLEEILRENLPAQAFCEGEIVDENGQVIGQHRGLPFYTVGQRKGLEIGGTGPWYVLRKDAEKNQLIACKAEALAQKTVRAENLFWRKEIQNAQTYTAQIRSTGRAQSCTVRQENAIITAEFDTPVSGVSSGQSLVIYDGDLCLGGGIIL